MDVAALSFLVLAELPSDGEPANVNQLLASALFPSTSEDLVPHLDIAKRYSIPGHKQ
jgi:hypothetical protein